MGRDVLTDEESRLVEAAASGEIWWPQGDRTIRSFVLRALALGQPLPGETSPRPIHDRGLRLDGALIEGELDFESATVSVPLWFFDCDFGEMITIRHAKLSLLCLRGCQIRGLAGHRTHISGPLLLNRSDKRAFQSKGRLELSGATIDAELSLNGAQIGGTGPIALDANGAKIGASLVLRGLQASGLVDLTRIAIAGNLHAQGATLDHPGNEKVVMIARGASVGGDAFLRNGFTATGLVDFTRAEFSGGLWMDGARLEVPHGTALSVNQARIGTALALTQEDASGNLGGCLRGHLDLRGAQVNEFRDDGSMWPDRKTGNLKIDGFRYERFGGRDTIMSGKKRVRWLKLQRPSDLRHGFKAQPWEHLIQTLRNMGHGNAARVVAIAKEQALHVSGTLSWRQWIWSWFIGLVTGYGLLPMRSVYASLLVWLFGVLVFASAGRQNIMAPSDPTILSSDYYLQNRVPPPDYPAFNPWMYSLDVFLPVIDLHQESRWLPSRASNGTALTSDEDAKVSYLLMAQRLSSRIDEQVSYTRAKAWLDIQIILGWVLTSLAIASFSGLLRPSGN